MIYGNCAYCGKPAAQQDHVVPRQLQRKLRETGRRLPRDLEATVFACTSCNYRKLTRHLLPASWEHRIDELNELTGGSPWRVWDGSTSHPAFTGTWKT